MYLHEIWWTLKYYVRVSVCCGEHMLRKSLKTPNCFATSRSCSEVNTIKLEMFYGFTSTDRCCVRTFLLIYRFLLSFSFNYAYVLTALLKFRNVATTIPMSLISLLTTTWFEFVTNRYSSGGNSYTNLCFRCARQL